MPFQSEAQRRLFHAAAKDPQIRKKHRLSLSGVKKMLQHERK